FASDRARRAAWNDSTTGGGYPRLRLAVQISEPTKVQSKPATTFVGRLEIVEIVAASHNPPRGGHFQDAAPQVTRLTAGVGSRRTKCLTERKSMKKRISTVLTAALACSLSGACGSNSTTAELDTDQDGLSDALELELRTDPYNVDSDD